MKKKENYLKVFVCFYNVLTNNSKLAIIKGILTKKSPVYVQYAVTKNCNLNCKMCGSNESRKNEKELNLNEINKLSDVLFKLGVGVVVITGGEPFLRRDLSDIIKAFVRNGIETRLQTNGLLATDYNVKKIVTAGIKEVSISLDSLYAENQDFINNKKGSWEKVINALYLFSKYLDKKGSMPIVNTVISKLNIKEIPNIVRFVTEIGYYNSIIPIHLSNDSDYIIRKNSNEFEFSKKDFRKIDDTYSKLIKMKKQGHNIYNSTRFLKECPDFLKFGKINWKCDSPYLYFSISPSGKFLPCVDLKGDKSMLDEDFIKVYKSKEFKAIVKKKVNNCKGCMYACYPEITYLCRKPNVLIERFIQSIKISRKTRRCIGFDDSLKIIERIKRKNILNNKL